MRMLGTGLAALAVGALVASSFSSTTAVAADEASIAVTVVDSAGAKVSGVDLTVEHASVSVGSLGVTGTDGVLEAAELPAGPVTIVATDIDATRSAADKTFAVKTQTATLANGQNPVTVVLDRSSVLTGRVLAPSGRPVQNVSVDARRGAVVEATSQMFTDAKGTYRMTGLAVGSPTMLVTRRAGEEVATLKAVAARPTIAREGSTVTHDVRGVQVICGVAFGASSPRKGYLRLTVRANAATVGLANPTGRVVVKNGARTVASIAVNGGFQTVTVKQPAGKRYAYRATSVGGDCLPWSIARAVTIRKK